MELIYKRHQCQTKMKWLLFESNQIWIQLDQDLGGWKEDSDVVGTFEIVAWKDLRGNILTVPGIERTWEANEVIKWQA